MTEARSAVGAQLRAALDAVAAGIAAALADLGLDNYRPRFSSIVRVLARSGPCSIGDLAEATGVTHSAASQTVNELSVRGLVTLERGLDGRRRIVSLATEARELLPVIEAEWAATDMAMTGLDAELSVPLQTSAAELTSALERRPFRQRIADAAASLGETELGTHQAALANAPEPPAEPAPPI